MAIDVRNLSVGMRIVYMDPGQTTAVQGGRIQEISPSKVYLKVNGRWHESRDTSILEILAESEELVNNELSEEDVNGE